jgi:hypothetical protein
MTAVTPAPALREPFIAAAQASLQAMYPERLVLRGPLDPAQLGDARLRRGVFALLAEGTDGWAGFTMREAQYGTLRFTIIAFGMTEDLVDTDDFSHYERLDQLEAQLEAELLGWCKTAKPEPLDAVYPLSATYSGGLEFPLTWLVMKLEALYI